MAIEPHVGWEFVQEFGGHPFGNLDLIRLPKPPANALAEDFVHVRLPLALDPECDDDDGRFTHLGLVHGGLLKSPAVVFIPYDDEPPRLKIVARGRLGGETKYRLEILIRDRFGAEMGGRPTIQQCLGNWL